MLESLRATVENSALSMAETKQQLFEELQTKEAEVERYRETNRRLQKDLDRLREEAAASRVAGGPLLSEEDVEIDFTDEVRCSLFAFGLGGPVKPQFGRE